MKRILSAAVGGVFLVAAAVGAQSQTARDPISGTWVGKAAPDGEAPDGAPADGPTITLNLKFDGRTVTGTGGPTGGPANGTVTAGTFDANTGALKLEVQLPDDGAPRKAVLDGVMFDNAFVGRMTLAGNTGRFHFTKTSASSSAPQTAGNVTQMLGAGFAEVSGWVLKAAEAVPADKYSYRPIGTVRTFGQQIAHVADAYNWYCAMAAGNKVEWSDAVEKGPDDKATLVAKLKTATDGCAAVYRGATLAPQVGAVIAHTNLHYGNIVTYMRMLGLTPPSS
jgi:uncharacterized damage-inducible protein DinB